MFAAIPSANSWTQTSTTTIPSASANLIVPNHHLASTFGSKLRACSQSTRLIWASEAVPQHSLCPCRSGARGRANRCIKQGRHRAIMPPQAFEQLGDAAEHAWATVQSEIKAKMADFRGQPGVLDGLREFAAAVDWTVQAV